MISARCWKWYAHPGKIFYRISRVTADEQKAVNRPKCLALYSKYRNRKFVMDDEVISQNVGPTQMEITYFTRITKI